MDMDYNKQNVARSEDLYNVNNNTQTQNNAINNTNNIDKANKAAAAGVTSAPSFQEQQSGRINEAYLESNTTTVEKTKLDNMEIRKQLAVHNVELNKMEKGNLYISSDKVGSVQTDMQRTMSLVGTVKPDVLGNYENDDESSVAERASAYSENKNDVLSPKTAEKINESNVENTEDRAAEAQAEQNIYENKNISERERDIPDGVAYKGNIASVMAGVMQ